MNKLMIFGDSVLKGVTFSSEKKRYVLCEHKYENLFAEKGIITENFCKMGATISKINEITNKKLESVDKNTVVLLGFGGNDSDYNWGEVSNSPNSNHTPNTAIDTFFKSYCSLIRKFQSLGCKVIVSNLVPLDADKYMNWISNGKSYDNILEFLGDKSMLYRGQEFFNQAVEQAAEETGCPLINLRRTFLQSRKYKSIICEDGIHPSQLGHNILDGTISDYFIRNMIPAIAV